MVILFLFLSLAHAANVLKWTTQPSSTSLGGTMSSVTVSVVDSSTETVQTSVVDTIIVVLDSGTLTGTTRQSLLSGAASFSTLSPWAAGSRYLVAFSSTLDPVYSSSFVVATASPYYITISGSTTATTGTTGGTWTVKLYDYLGNLYTSAYSITMALYGDATATLGGTTTVTTSSGVATFSTLTISKAGTFYLYPTISGTSIVPNAISVTVTSSSTPASMMFSSLGSIGIGDLFSVTVGFYDAGGNLLTTASDSITLSIDQGALGGTLTQSSSSGVTTFSSIYMTSATNTGTRTLTATCSTYSLTALTTTFTATRTAALTFTLSSEPQVKKNAGSYSYTLYLSVKPTSSVSVAITSSDTSKITVTSSPVTFTTSNYNTAQTVTLNILLAGFGSMTSMQETVTISHAMSGDTNYQTYGLFSGCDQISSGGALTITVLNTIAQNAIKLHGTFYAQEGASATYSVALSASPSSTVTVTPQSSDLTITSGALSFDSSNYGTGQSVTYNAAHGTIGTLSYKKLAISHSISTTDISFEKAIAPDAEIVIVSASSSIYQVVQSSWPVIYEGSTTTTATYTMYLSHTPSNPVTISLTTSAPLSVSPPSLTFDSSDYTTAQTVTITYTRDSTARALTYYVEISHSVSSSDASYDKIENFSIAKDLNVFVMNSCTYGQYTNPTSGGGCINCPEGYECPDPVTKNACSAKYHSPDGQFTCVPCPPGYYCAGASAKVACSSGYYSLGFATSCTQCAAGYACISANSPPAECPLGTYSTAGSTSCTPLTGSQVGWPDQTPSTCTLGTIPSVIRTHCETCPAGWYCPDNTQRTITICAIGTYAAPGSSSCTSCPAGHACSRSEDLGTCPEGYYSTLGLGSCVECPPGSYCTGGAKTTCSGSSQYGQTACQQCPQDYYCPEGLPPIPCPPGYVAALGDGVCTKCLAGEYRGSGACVTCPAGFFCPNPVSPPYPCFFGTYSLAGASSCTPCDVGYTCDQGSSSNQQYTCPNGFKCAQIAVDGSTQLASWPVPCASGKYGAGCTTDCPAGYYCPGGTIDYQKFPCPPGHYCTSASATPTPCAANKYNPHWGSVDSTFCLSVSAGYFSYQGSPRQLICPPGYYCTGSANPAQCAAGTYFFGLGATSSSDCVTCPLGYYCLIGSIQPTPCPIYYISSSTGATQASDCTKCPAGKHCPVTRRTSTTAELPCWPGYYCTSGAAPTKNAAGYICESTILTASGGCTTQCPAGYYCPSGTADSRQPKIPCPAGSYCPSGASSATNCPAGYWSNKNYLTASSECSPCPPGYYCTAGSTSTKICQPGYYCPPKTTSSSQYPCPTGTYSPYSGLRFQAECITCPLGYYCPSTGLNLPTASGTGNAVTTTGATSATTCTAGYYCPSNVNSVMLPCGKGKYSASGATACSTCSAGYYCPLNNTSNTSMNSNKCPAGLFCNSGTDHYPTNLYDRCSAGHYCLQATSTETPCSAGTLRSLPGASQSSDCTNVPAGYYVDTPGATQPSGVCDTGYVCPTGSTSAQESACALGTFRMITGGTTSSDCGECPAGFYCSAGATTPTICPVGNYCPAGSSTPTVCPEGTFNPGTQMIRDTDCISCPAGYYCQGTGQSAITNPCNAGYLCEGKNIDGYGVTSSSTSQNPCPVGGYCPTGTAYAIPCDPGYYLPTPGASSSANCVTCPVGKYCAGATDTPTGDCKAGFYCDGTAKSDSQHAARAGYYSSAGASADTPCDAGTYNPAQGQSSCLTCPDGFYCPTTAMQVPTMCSAGYYCPSGSTSETACGVGYYNLWKGMKSSSDCVSCPSGYACTTTAISTTGGMTLCNAGYWCLTGASSVTPSLVSGKYGPCPQGYYCLQGSGAPTPCPPGTYDSSAGGLTALSGCTDCPTGKYCMGLALTAVTGDCSAGYDCSTKRTIPNPIADICSTGHYCLGGTNTETPCAAGYYQPNEGQSSCEDCPAGFYCTLGTSNYITYECPAGYYCPKNTQSSTANPCSSGTYNPITGGQDTTWCLSCDAGKYCSGTGLSATSGSCTQGYYCQTGTSTATPSTYCGLGEYCPTGSSKAKRCDAGYYCDAIKLGAPVGQCSAGYYCISGAQSATPTDGTTGNICPKGYYCTAGSIAPTPCPAGTYNPSLGKSLSTDCLSCPQGFYCEGSALITDTGSCAAGWYCPTGSKTANENGCTAGNKCPAGSYQQTACTSGTYQPQKLQSTCLTCPAGYYCNGSGLTVASICLAGYYCPSGTGDYTVYACSAGTYNPAQGMSSSSACLTCPPGSYCSGVGQSAVTGTCINGCYCTGGASNSCQNSCPAGYYCPSGAARQIECPPGKYCATTNLHAPTGDCTAGYLCILKATTPNPTDGTLGRMCVAGTYCTSGTDHEIPCDIGTFSNSAGQTSSSACTSCTAGSYCNTLGATGITGSCSAGFYCVAGSTSSTPSGGICPVGKYCPSGSATYTSCPAGEYNDIQGQSACFTCPAGFTCEGDTNSPVQCDPGYYCSGGNSVYSNNPQCAAGTYNPFKGQISCLACPIGFDCPLGATAPTICPAGYYCPTGTGKTICPSGTYSEITGLQSASNCKPCTTGKYCTGGVVVGDCDAGYFCQGGNSVPNPNDIISDTVYGIKCPTGYYCLVGTTLPTPCPYGKFTTTTGATQSSDCQVCTAGYYCIPGDPTPYKCPAGAYCPTASNSPTWCPTLKYSATIMATADTTCISCPAGYLCTSTGIGDYKRFPCPPGSYCTAGSTTSTKCPAGTWAAKSATASESDCDKCPAGSYCLSGATTINPCQDWTWCDTGSSKEGTCPGGYYCHQNQTELVSCMAGFYCPETPDVLTTPTPPYRCDTGTYCPPGSNSATNCPNGYIYVPYSQRKTLWQSCISCTAGYYSASDNTCKECNAGYYCADAASSATPESLDTDGGYPCTAGYYCTKATPFPVACPAGTYNKYTEGKSIGDCLPCPSNTYSDVEGSAGCYPCGPNSRASEGQTTCNCVGVNRSYMKRDGTCRCTPGYVFYTEGINSSDDDSDQDCVSLVRPLCQSGYVRDLSGDCVQRSDCSAQCQGGSGKRNPDSGICFCEDTYSTTDVCDYSCQGNLTTVTLNTDGTFTVNITKWIGKTKIVETEIVDFQSTEGYTGRAYCQDGYSCSVKTIEIDGTTKAFTSNLQPKPFLEATGRRLASSNKKLMNPVVCLELGESMVFTIPTVDDYPYYMKDSVLNTNPSFDYGPFLELEQVIKGGQNVKYFTYSFREAGRYVFATNSDKNNVLIVSVMTSDQQCSSPQIRERSAGTVTKAGVYQDHNINEETDWKIFLFMMMVFLLFIIFLSTVQIFHRRAQKRLIKKNLEDFKKTLQSQAAVIKGNDESVVDDQPAGKQVVAGALNPQLFQAIYEKLLELSDLMRNRIKSTKDKNSEELASLLESLKDLKNVISGTLNPNAVSSGVNQNYEEEMAYIASLNKLDPKSESETKKLEEKIRNDPKLEEDQKQALLDELNENLSNLEAQLAEDRVHAENTLKNRIEERSKRRRELLQKKNALEEEERQAKERMQRELKDAENLAQEAEKEYEKEKRRARERVFGNVAKNMRKEILENIRRNPEKEEEILNQYEREMEAMEQNLTDEKGMQHRDLMRRIEERRNRKRGDAQNRADAAKEEYHETTKELEKVNKYIELLNSFEQNIDVVATPTIKQIGISEADERVIDRRFEDMQKQSDIAHDSAKSQLEKQKQKLFTELSKASNASERDDILENLRNIENQIDDANKQREQDQKRILAERLQERQRLRREKKQRAQEAEKEVVSDQKVNTEQFRKNEDRMKKLEDLIKSLPKDEQMETVKQLLADKHDRELIELQNLQQKRAADIHAEKLRNSLENKAAAIKGAQKHLAEVPDNQKQAYVASLILENDQESQKDFENTWHDHQKKCNDELLKLLDKQMNEVKETIRRLGVDSAINPEMQKLNDDFLKRQADMEREANERMDALERQRNDLERLAREKKEELESQMAEARQQAEIERARKELLEKQKKEQEEAKRRGNLTKQQMEELIAQHQKELEQLEGSLASEKERQQASLKKKLEEKRERRRKLLQVPDDMKHLEVKTAQLLKEFRVVKHREPEIDEDILSELLRRVIRVEQIISNVDTAQFDGVMRGLQHLSEKLKNYE